MRLSLLPVVLFGFVECILFALGVPQAGAEGARGRAAVDTVVAAESEAVPKMVQACVKGSRPARMHDRAVGGRGLVE
jgi:hypothetical protein